MDGYEASTYGDGFADVYDDWYTDVSDVTAAVEAVADLVDAAGGGPVLELGVGTGRLALPLTAAGLDVIGVDASKEMLRRLQAKDHDGRVRAVLGDMTELPAEVPGGCAVVLLSFNTLFNLPSAEAQERCLTAATSRLVDGGRVVVEAFVPAEDMSSFGRRLEPVRIAVDEVVLSVSEVGDDGHTVTGTHVHVRDGDVRLRPWRLHVLGPDELDEVAASAGLELTARYAGWRGEEFGTDSDTAVSLYRPTVPSAGQTGR